MREVAIIGAGPAGCAAAIALAQAGRRPLLLERQPAPKESVCGEFLGPDAAAALRRCGLDLAALGALPLRGLRLGVGGREAAVALPFPAWSLPRAVLDGALQQAAAVAGAELLRGVNVAGVRGAAEGWHLDGPAVGARHLVLATGKRELRGLQRQHRRATAIGLKLPLMGVPLREEVALLSFPGGYAGLQPRAGGGANLCAALWAAPGEAARDADALLARIATASRLGERLLGDARALLPRPLAVAAVPYGFRQPAAEGQPYRVGDQLSVIPSFTGEGVAMALHSGLQAADAILAATPAHRFHASWARRSARPMGWAALVGMALRRAPGLAATAAHLLPALAQHIAQRTRLS